MDLRLATLKQSLSICCTMFQHWINAERFPVSHLCVNTLPASWVMASSTIFQYSQQEGFYRVPLPAARQTPNLEYQWLERSNSRHQVSSRLKRSEKIAENFAESGRLPRHFRILLHAVNLRHGTDGFTSPPKEGALRIFSPEKSDGFIYKLCLKQFSL